MPIQKFPNPTDTTEEGIVAFGGDLEPESLLLAYSQGIFPWPIEGLPLPWFCPQLRAILEWPRLHVSRSLRKFIKKSSYKITVDRAFEKVIENCAAISRQGQDGTWITQDFISAYSKLHKLGHAHSVEIWSEDRLVGGIYGVEVNGVFAGESMFHLEPNTSKIGIIYLMEYLHQRGLDWMDIQVMTPHMEAMGAREIPRSEFLDLLSKQRSRSLKLF